MPCKREANSKAKALRLFAVLPCESLPSAAGDRYASVKAYQQHRGLPLDENDLWIAEITLPIDATLVSRDSDFHAIEGLAVVEP